MRNLKCVHHTWTKGSSELLDLTASTWNAAANVILCAYGPSKCKQVIELKQISALIADGEHTETLLASWDAPCPLPELDCDKIINLHHFEHNNTSCLVLAGGDLVVVRGEIAAGQEKIEIVGSVDVGISAAAWSPDEELLVVITRAATVLFMTPDFESVADTAFSPDDVKLSKHVNVGWGKSETQFKGKRAKALRDPTMPEKVDEGTLSPADGQEVFVSWRGDGAFVAINSIEDNTRRIIRVYSREGVLDSVSEPVDGLEGSISWRPQGNLIAGVQRLNGQINLIFFERNGLRHGQSLLKDNTAGELSLNPVDLNWNTDSTVLAVSYGDHIELWTMGNYHYYLKQDIRLGADATARRIHACWHAEEPLRLLAFQETLNKAQQDDLVITAKPLPVIDQGVHQFRFVFDLNNGSATPPIDLGLVVVIDRHTLKITPLAIANVPPPMSLHEIDLSKHIRDVAVNRSSTRIAALHENMVTILTYTNQTHPRAAPQTEKIFKLDIDGTFDACQISFLGDEHLFVLLFELNTNTAALYTVQTSTISPLGKMSSTVRLFPSFNHQDLCFLAANTLSSIRRGSSLTPSEDGIVVKSLCNVPAMTTWVEVFSHGEQHIVFARTNTGVLYADEKPLLRNCTSFLVTNSHLLVTTTNHLLKFLHITIGTDLEVPPDQPETDERCRNIERGARLVSVMPSSYAVVLQMPRGNLETIFPRALVLAAIRTSISDRNYKKAFLICRSQRVDMNILHDHAPAQFLRDIKLVVEQIGKTEHVDLLLSQFRAEDVSQTLYKETLPKSRTGEVGQHIGSAVHPPQSSHDPTKVNRICDGFLAVLSDFNPPRIQNIISTNVCKTPPDVESALQVIGKLRESALSQVETAVEHMCFLVDVNIVYERALGLYDLELALLVAQQSQKDPREYLPYLQSLQEMPRLRRLFTIDDHLGKRSKAVKHLFDIGNIEELSEYMVKHELYNQVLDLYKYQPNEQSSILRTYAIFLNSRNRFREAGIAYEALADFTAASEAYRAAIMWRESLSCANSASLPEGEVRDLAEALLETLLEAKDFTSAAVISLDYLQDLARAARLYCKAYKFSEATRIVGLHRQTELLDSVVDPGLVESSGLVTELLADCKTQLAAQIPRLRELRLMKLEDPLAFFDGMETADIPDNVSLAPTDTSTAGGTIFTRYTNRTGTVNTTSSRKTSKNRRREERKRARGKKGSVYEEEYLVNSIGRLVERINSINDDVSRLIEGLLRRSMRERAMAIEVTMLEVVQICQSCIAEVYDTADATTLEGMSEDRTERVVGADAVLQESMDSVKDRKPPLVSAYTRTPLLGG